MFRLSLIATLILFVSPCAMAKPYIYSKDWTSRNTVKWEKMFGPLKTQNNLNYLEIGVYEGRTLIWVMENLLPDSSNRATVIDIFEGDLQKRFEHNLKVSGIDRQRVQVMKGSSQKLLKNLPEESYDLIYVDGDHRGSAVLTDAVLAWPLLKHGGYMVFDDYELRFFSREEENSAVAIDTFVRLFYKELRVVRKGYQFVVQKQKMYHVPANISPQDPARFTSI